MMRVAAIIALLLVVTGPAHAIEAELAFEDPAMQARYKTLTKELRCLMCKNEAISDSNSMIAADLRRQVKEMMEDGATDDEIRDYMVSRYGDFVLYKPRFNKRSFLLYTSPFILMALGVVILVTIIVRKSRMPIDDDAPADDAPEKETGASA